MAITFSDGSATIGATEYFLASKSTSATYQTADAVMQAFIDLTNMAAGDQYQITAYEKINGSTARTIQRWFVSGAQAMAGFVTPALVVGDGWEIGVKKLAGTDRSIGFSVRSVN
jgi:hypothetical protein